jgi:hypothetical protein
MPKEVFRKKQGLSKPEINSVAKVDGVDSITKAIEYIIEKYIEIFPGNDRPLDGKKGQRQIQRKLPPLRK